LGNYDPLTEMTTGQIEKATKFLVNGKVRIEAATVYEVEGETGNYVVTIFPEESKLHHTCTCPRIGTCSHIAAAMLFDKELHKVIDEKLGVDKKKRAKTSKPRAKKRHLKTVD
jgi:uncharacterized Zn finger protein